MPSLSRLNLTSFHVLLVEDNLLLRGILEDFLTERGARYTSFTSADDALIAALKGIRPDLVLTDHLLPGQLTGAELVQMLVGRWPGLPTVITSGYGAAITASLPRHAVYIQKPWGIDALESAISQAFQ